MVFFMEFNRGSKKLINAWAFYDWANSAYALVISTAIFPIYYESVTADNEGLVSFFGTQFHNTTLYTYALSFSFLVIAFLSPILSGIADYMGNKKRFMQFFCYLGSLSVMSLYFFTGVENLWIGILFTILASIGFWGSLVFYNAYLPEVAFPEQQDRVSAKGFMLGYFGSVFLLLFNLTMVMNPHWYGITDPTLPSRISFLMVGVWWLGFAQYTFSVLPNNIYNHKPKREFIMEGFKALRTVFIELVYYPQLKRYLIAFFLYSVGVQTTILLSTVYGKRELGLETSNLIITILLVQLVGIVGAYVFSRISERFGNLVSLKITVIIWAIASYGAFILHRDDPDVYYKFYALGGVLGFVLGAIQSLSRSTYSKMLPDETENHATYFSFYDVTEKISIVLGTFIFGLAIALTNSMKTSILILSIFFFAGFIVLNFIKKTKYVN